MAQIDISIEDAVLSDPDIVVKIIKFAGQLDETNVDDKAKEIYDVIESLPKGSSIIFDFIDLEYMNSKAVGYVTDFYSKIVEKGGQLIIARARENILDILNVVGITQIVKTCATLDEAKLEIMRTNEHPKQE